MATHMNTNKDSNNKISSVSWPCTLLPSRILLNPDEPNDPYQLYGRGSVPPKNSGTIRIFVDGCFDMFHFGHSNALRQARLLGAELFVGCHSDEEIIKYKGPPIMNEEDRYEALRDCKWVDYVVENCPYCTRLKDIERFEIDFVAHGDDISLGLNGENSYQDIINADRFKVFKRTDGISTTDLVGRMLLCMKTHMIQGEPTLQIQEEKPQTLRYLTTSHKIVQFSNNTAPKDDDIVVYIDGTFDLFHVGHMRALECAKSLGTYLIVGIHLDDVVNSKKGLNYPIMNINERVLGVLSCRFVDEVVMGVPFGVSKQIIQSLGIHIVAGGKLRDCLQNEDLYALPKNLGIFRPIDSHCDMSTEMIIGRVLNNKKVFMDRQATKKKKDILSEELKVDEYRNIKEI